MCGRYSLTTPLEAVRKVFGFAERPNLAPRANIAPSQAVAAVRLAPGGERRGSGERPEAERRFVWLRWGLIPAWAKDLSIGSRMINARAEGVAEKPAFRAAFRKRRCLILADGFYEWTSEGGRKQPYRITLADGRPFAFAGLWERWFGPSGGAGAGDDVAGDDVAGDDVAGDDVAGDDVAGDDVAAIESCTIVTTEANSLLLPIHHRMPVILAPADVAAWLDPETPGPAAHALLRPAPAEALICYRVSNRINSPANDDPSLIEPVDAPGGETGQPWLL